MPFRTLLHAVCKKVLLVSTFFYGATMPSDALADVCQLSTVGLQTVSVSNVYDGDTVRLSDGRKVRLIGVNTPELGKKDSSEEPWSRQAKRYLEKTISDTKALYIRLGSEPKDRHGRTLAHLFDSSGYSLEARLVENGLGFAVSIPPNTLLSSCLFSKENSARKNRLGVWGVSSIGYFVRDSSVRPGFSLVRGSVRKTYLPDGKTWWIDVGEELAVRIPVSAQSHFSKSDLQALSGKMIEVRGWVVSRKLSQKDLKRGYKSMIITLTHPDMIKKQ